SITRVVNPTVPGPQFNYVFVADLFIIGAGIDDSIIRKAIDIGVAKGKGSLGKSDLYRKAMESVKVSGENRGLLFVDVSKIVDLIKAFPIPGLDQANVTDGIEKTLGVIETIAGALSFNYSKKAVDRIDFNMFFAKNKNVKDADILDAWSVKPADIKNLSFVPSGAVLFSMSNTVDIAKLWELWKNSLRQQAPERADEILSTVDQFESDTGVSIQDDILSWIGDEFGFLLSDVDMGGLFPFPKIALIIKVTDGAKATASLGKITNVIVEKSVPEGVTEETEGEAAASPIKASSESYGGQTLQSLEIRLPYQSLTPAYAVMDDYLIIGTSKETVKNLIDTKDGKAKSVKSDAAFKTATKGFPVKVNQLGFLNATRALDLIIEITTWANSLQQQAAGTPSTETAAAITETVIPVLNALKTVESIGVVAVNEKDGIEQSVHIEIKK
ncbi:MAG: DUF3352 domain-containing protein, partial [Candidatus Theseobacter exili]|nr:DUF3352 domain-containing protein [Candidatus Theseobacter exili]